MAGRVLSRALRGLEAGVLLFAYQARRSPEVLLWYLVFPLVFLGIIRFALLGGPEAIVVGVVGDAPVDALEAEGFEVVEYDSLEEAMRDLAGGEVAAVVDYSGGSARVYYAYQSLKGVAVLAAEVLAHGSREDLPIPVVKAPLGGEAELGRLMAMYSVNIIGVQAVYIALYGGMVELVYMRRDGSLKMVASSPGGAATLLAFLTGYSVAATAASSTVIIAAAAAMGANYSGVTPAGVAAAAFLLLAGMATIFAAALPLSLAIKRHETASAIAGLAGFVAVMGMGLAIPREELPEPLHSIAAYFPMTMAVEAARGALLGAAGPLEALVEPKLLYLMLAASLALGAASYRRLIAYAVEE